MNVSARSNAAVCRQPAGNLATTSLAIGFIALLYVAPLSAQSAKSLLEMLTNPQAQDMPPLVRAASDGAMLAGKLIVETIPRVTLALHRGDKLHPADPQRLAAASPDIIVPARIEALRLPSHFLTTENQSDRTVLDAVFSGKIPDYFQNIEPAANAPKVDFVKPGPLSAAVADLPQPLAPQVETAPLAMALPVLAAMTRQDALKLPDAFLIVPPPPITLPAVQAQTIPAATPDLTVLSPVAPANLSAAAPGDPSAATPGERLAAFVAPTIKGEPVLPVAPDGDNTVDPLPSAADPIDPQVPVVPDFVGRDLHLALQVELKRLNCLSGKADGSFGKGSLGALDLFFKTSGLTRASADPSQAVLDQLKAASASTCDSPYAPAVQAVAATPPKKAASSKPAKTTVPVKTPQVATPPKPPKPAKSTEDPCVKNPASCMSFN